jgi:tripeptide aminopeptidase
LLGSDDKSGVAVVMTLVERLLRETKRKHGLIRVCFTPDEEIGRGVDKLDLRMLGADAAYTLDGGAPGEICWETFSGDAAEVIIDGITTPPWRRQRDGHAAYLAGKLPGSAAARAARRKQPTGGRDSFTRSMSKVGLSGPS